MGTIVEFLIGIADAIVIVFKYLIDTVVSLANIIKMLLYFIPKIPTYFTWVPEECLAIMTLLFSIVVVYKIVGREG